MTTFNRAQFAPAHHHSPADEQGFTLIEMIIMVAVIAILATVALPNYTQSKITSNETAVIATMKSLMTSELKFKMSGYVDEDGDSSFEHGTLREMTGTHTLRNTDEALSPTEMPASLGNVDGAGRARKHGYFFAMYLADSAGLGLADTDDNIGSIDPDLAEHYWTCVAWPIQPGATGRNAFFANQRGEVLKCLSGNYGGTANVPPAGAANLGVTTPDHINSNDLAVGRIGSDGFHWSVVR